ncbi:tannase/feruloyl esterase family alpha/beta hydrolase [Paraburkholderia agricolaris]|uniref:Tannase/feruloyl esterase family alpha/beta hydrolase n=1 Tax=Paraburkholderia agricolaris TaxID=2152888 RepID=A0ABW8ZV59_9BURK
MKDRFWSGRTWFALILAGGFFAAILTGCGNSVDSSSSKPLIDYATLCSAINGKQFNGIVVTETKRITQSGSVPGYCKVSATGASGTNLDIEVDLPDNWSNRLVHAGGGGFDGGIPTVEIVSGQYPLMQPLQRGLAYTASNGGNRTGDPAEIAANATERTDFAYAATGTTVHFAKAVITAFYGTPPKYTYFVGASNGGRDAYVAAQDIPADYDGIIAGADSMNMGTIVTAWLNIGSRAGSGAMPSSAQWTAAYNSAVAQCGNANGVILNPAACTFDPATLQCGVAGASAATCLSPAQLQTVQQTLEPISTSSNGEIFAGRYWADFGNLAGPGYYGNVGGGFAAIATGNTGWLLPANAPGSLQTNFDVNVSYTALAAALESTGIDHKLSAIAQYLTSGKKLISYIGGADPLVSPRDHLRNWLTVTQMAGASAENTRFYVEPGVDHVLGGNGPDQADYLGAMIAWVEQGTVPGQLLLTKFDTNGHAVMTLPDCPYPLLAHYSGSGDISTASNYSCSNS